MQAILYLFDATIDTLRRVLFGVAVVLTVICLVDWLVRTRRLSPFGSVARFMRTTFDPLLKPIERRVVRAGGVPSSAPWWALGGVVLGGIVLLGVLGFVRGQVAFAMFSLSSGPNGFVRLLITWGFAILQIALIVRVLLSWFPMRPGAWYWRFSYRLTEPMLKPLRRIIPLVGMMDITPIVAWFVLNLAEGFLLRAI
jgi:YggT family protein